MRLIKFHGVNKYLLSNMQQHLLNFNNVFNFNDPFEGPFRYKSYTGYDQFKKFYLEKYTGKPDLLDYYYNNPKEFESLLNRTNDWRWKNNAVSCFSKKENECSILMWSHYAKSENGNSHEGLCLVFETEELEFYPQETIPGTLIGSVSKALEVSYTDTYLSSDPTLRHLNSETFLTTKFTPWSYELEYRYIAPKAGRYYFPKESLKEVIFGIRLSESDREAFREVFEKFYSDVKLSMIQLKNDHFAFEKVDYNNAAHK